MSQYRIAVNTSLTSVTYGTPRLAIGVEVIRAIVVGGGGGGGITDGDKGDITVSGSGTVWTIDAGAVTLAKMANIATDSFLGRDTAGTGVPEVLSVATAKTLLSLTGTNSGDVTLAGTPDYLTIAGQVITLGQIDLTTDVTGRLPFANLATVASGKILGRHGGGSGNVQEVGLDGGLEFQGANIRREALTGDVTAPAGSNTTTITPAINPTWVTSLPWSKITTTPTTLSGYGITDAVATTDTRLIQPTAVDASQMIPRTANGVSLATTEYATNKQVFDYIGFDFTTQQTATFDVVTPTGWTGSTVAFIPIWTAASSSGTLELEFSARVYADDDAIDQAYGTAQSSTDTLLAANDIHYGPQTDAVTPAGTVAAQRLMTVQIARDVATDTLGAIALLKKVLVIWL